jgi:microsomal dipeptidase-like Zn-dependent dipeptidase
LTSGVSVLVDLHAHFPMHVPMGRRGSTHDHVRAWSRRRWQSRVVNLISGLANYQGPGDTPSVTGRLMREGDVGVVLSVLYAPFDEMDLGQPYGAAPRGGYFEDILAELQAVEEYASSGGENLVIAHSPAELDAAITGGRSALIHCIEGGFQLGRDEQQVRDHVATLAQRGVAYVTVAHLFWRSVATNAPALPFLPDWLYHRVFPQPQEGLSELGRAAVHAMIDHGVLVDVTHMSARAVDETLGLFERRDPDGRIPVIATHMACRLGKLEYCLTDDTIRRIGARGGVLGCILCEHYITSGLPGRAGSYEDSVRALCAHIDRIHEVTGTFDHVAIGSDLDGYIKPALPGLEHLGRMRALQQSLGERYGPEVSEKICSANALRVLRSAWRAPQPSRT